MGEIVVLGAGGTLGRALGHVLQERGRPHARVTRAELDLARIDEIGPFLASAGATAVINASSFSDVNGAEDPQRREEVFAINRDAPRAMARACRRLEIPFVHVSTDYVFDGRLRRPYREDDAVGPLQVYGRSKLEGETAVGEEHPAALIARTSTLFGSAKRLRPHYVDAILLQARARSALQVVELPVASPTYAPDLARALLRLLDDGVRGIVHAVNDGPASRLDLARATVEAAGLADRVAVDVRPADPGGPRRPDYSVLDTARLRAASAGMRPWRDALAEYVERFG